MIASPTQTSRTVSASIIALGQVSAIGFTLVLAAILSRTLEKEVYGTFRQVLYVYTTMAVVFEIGLPKAVPYFLPKVSLSEGKGLLIKILAFLALCGIAFSFALYFGADLAGALLRNENLPNLLRAYSPMPLLMLPTIALPGVCMTHQRPIAVAVFQALTKLVALLTISWLVLLGLPMVTVIRAWVLISIGILLLAIHLMFAPYRGAPIVPSSYKTIDILKFGLPLVLASIAGTLLTGADRFVVSRFFGAEVFAVYVNGAMEFPLVSLLTGSIAIVLLPDFARTAAYSGREKDMCDIWCRTIKKSAAFLYPCAGFAFFFAEDLMRLLYSEKYVGSALFFRIYLTATFIRVVPYLPLMLGLGAVRSYLLGAILACVIAWGGAMGLCLYFGTAALAAVSYVCAVYAMCFFFIIILSRQLGVGFLQMLPFRDILAYIGAATVSAFLSYVAAIQITGNLLPSVVLRLTAGFSIFCLIYMVSARFIGLDTLAILYPVTDRFRKRRAEPLKLRDDRGNR